MTKTSTLTPAQHTRCNNSRAAAILRLSKNRKFQSVEAALRKWASELPEGTSVASRISDEGTSGVIERIARFYELK